MAEIPEPPEALAELQRQRGRMVDVLKRVAGVLQRAGIPFALTAGYAVYARGGGLSEHDVDFLIREADADAALDALETDGLTPLRPPEDWLVKVYDQEIMVDLIFRPVQRPVTDDMLADTEIIGVGGCHMPVMSATVLMTHKVLSLDAHSCDYAPALQLARLLREQIDWDRMAKDVAGAPYAEAFLYLAARLDIAPVTEEA